MDLNSVQKLLGVSKDQVEHGLELHRKSIVIDLLAGGPDVWSDARIKKMNEMLDAGKPYEVVAKEMGKIYREELETPGSDTRRKWVEAIKKSGVTCISVSYAHAKNMEESMKGISGAYRQLNKFRDNLMNATCVEDIRRAKKEGKMAVMINAQTTLMIGQNLDNLDVLYGLGVRQMCLTYNLRNFVADGCTERQDSGLSHFGVKVIERMNKLGMVVDTNHTGMQSTIEAAEVSKDPIVTSHTGCRAVYNHDRCHTDEAIKAVAEKGGVVGIMKVPFFLAKEPTLKDWLDHVDHAVEVAGVDHVAVGTDTADNIGCPDRWGDLSMKKLLEDYFFYGFRPEHKITGTTFPPRPDDLMAWGNWPKNTVGLLSRGYSDQEVHKIIGGNWLRVLEKGIG